MHKFDAGGLTPGKENLCAMTENMQADDVQRRKPRVVRCCLKHLLSFFKTETFFPPAATYIMKTDEERQYRERCERNR